MKKVFIDYARKERNKLSKTIILKMEIALKNCYIPLKKENLLSKKNEEYYIIFNRLTSYPFKIIEKYYFRNPINSLRKHILVFRIKNNLI